uniref:SpoVT-AbrB domain-containing protein n=1 Tax=uncultured Parcubacteria group bacterium TaxID=221218 RepID=A0A1L3KS49_9BACT|nr:hypothetical protein [uncultured Parcubacteria group bacterium]
MNTKIIQKATSRGKITLPGQWRKKFPTNQYLVEVEEDLLKIKPFEVDTAGQLEEQVKVLNCVNRFEGLAIKGRKFAKKRGIKMDDVLKDD